MQTTGWKKGDEGKGEWIKHHTLLEQNRKETKTAKWFSPGSAVLWFSLSPLRIIRLCASDAEYRSGGCRQPV